MSIVEQVRAAAIGIPTGRVASYGDIGAMIGAGPRQVGRAMTFLDDDVPWWRVVYANGTPASCHGGRAHGLLHDERTPMVGARVNMRLARHQPATSLPVCGLPTRPRHFVHLTTRER